MTLAEQLEQMGIEKGMEKGMEKGIQKGMERGIQKGIQQTTNDMAIKMLKEGTELGFISKITGLSVQDIQKLDS